MADAPRNNQPKTRGRLFQPGNPGRPRGARHHVTRAVEELLAGEHQALSRKAIELALKGDTIALRLCLDRIAPPRRDAPISITLPPIGDAAGLVEAGSLVAAALASGDITPDEAARCMAVLHAQRQILETAELAARIAALEAGYSTGLAPPHDALPIEALPLPAMPVIAQVADPEFSGEAEKSPSREMTSEENSVMRLISLESPSEAGGRHRGKVRLELAPIGILDTLSKRGFLEIMTKRDGHVRIEWTSLGASWRRSMT
jgi:hypothetical protein